MGYSESGHPFRQPEPNLISHPVSDDDSLGRLLCRLKRIADCFEGGELYIRKHPLYLLHPANIDVVDHVPHLGVN